MTVLRRQRQLHAPIMNNSLLPFRALASLTLSFSLAHSLSGGAFTLTEQNASGIGTAFSSSAEARDASTIFYNPAGLTRLERAEALLKEQLDAARPTTAALSITANITGADVYIDDTPQGQLPMTLTLTPGAHRVEIRHPGHHPYFEEITAEAGVYPLDLINYCIIPNP